MDEFLIAIHIDLIRENLNPVQEQMKNTTKRFEYWIAHVIAQEKLPVFGKRRKADGWVSVQRKLQRGLHTDEMITIDGLLLIAAKDYEEAVEMAKGYPLSRGGVIVEVCMTIQAA